MLRHLKNEKIILAWLLTVFLVATTGCDNSASTGLSTAKVNGTVTLDGIPVEGAAIVFIPVNLRNDENQILKLAYADTDSKGYFELAYSDNSPDIIGTKYNILITKYKSNSSDNHQPLAAPWPLALLPESIAKFSTFNESKELIPENYNVNSELFFEFSSSSENVRKNFKLSTIDPALK